MVWSLFFFIHITLSIDILGRYFILVTALGLEGLTIERGLVLYPIHTNMLNMFKNNLLIPNTPLKLTR